MSDQLPQRKRARGYSLRTQLFFKNNEQKQFTPDLESGISVPTDEDHIVPPIEQEPIELSTIGTQVAQSTIPSASFSSSDSFEQERIRQSPKVKAYAGERGKILKGLADLKSLVLNVRPYRKSKDGRKIPISVQGDHNNEFEQITHEDRKLLIDERYHKPYLDNTISSARYSIYSFIPKQLYFQFSKVANVYFMTVSILQMVPSWSTTGTYSTIIPLLIFISISILREGYDDWKRHLQDKRENNKFSKVIKLKDDGSEEPVLYPISRATSSSQLNPDQYANDSNDNDLMNNDDEDNSNTEANSFRNENTLKRNGLKIAKVKWKDIKVGDIIKLEQDDAVPADIILLTSDGQNENEVLVETMDLDGETNLKSRVPHNKVSSYVNTARGLRSFSGSVIIEDPNPDLYNFEGNVKIGDEIFPLGPENVIYRGSIIRNTQNLIGLVIFTGEESKIRMNAIKNPRTKAPKLQKAINLIVCFMVFIVLCLAMFSFMAQRILMKRYWDRAWYLYNQEAGVAPTILSFIIMYNTLIPLSLYVTTELIKVVQSLFLHWDIDMYHQPSNTPCESRTATILEELGQVSYIFSDKTGTLTDNLMIFRKFSVGGSAWSHELDDSSESTTSSEELHKHFTESGSMATPRGSIDVRGGTARYTGRSSLASAVASSLRNPVNNPSSFGHSGRQLEVKTTVELLKHIQEHPNSVFSKKAKFFILSLSLCHTCLPKIASEELDDIEYQSSSPDELALVIAARDMGYVVFGKNQKDLTIRTYPNGLDNDSIDEKYELLNVVEFTSARKRMSVIVRFPDGRICMICKGADNIILEKLNNHSLVNRKKDELQKKSSVRKASEAQVVLQQRKSMDMRPKKSFQLPRPSLGASSFQSAINTIDDIIPMTHRDSQEIDEIYLESRKSLGLQQKQKYNIRSTEDYIANDKLILNEEFVLEKTLDHIEEFSTEGLRTLLYSYKWLKQEDYDQWSKEFAEAKTSLVDRAQNIEKVGGLLENNFELLGATAIEDKLQDGVSETIENLRRAGIKLWMLTGDKRETAINIGYSCKLIKDYSTLVILDSHDEDVISKMAAAELEIGKGTVAHCVVVIDGATLSDFETDTSVLSMFISLCTKTDSVICCRASPSQKAMMVTSIRRLKKNEVTLAVGDGANDIAMIQSADIGIGITGKEGLQAARASDYSVAQFRYLQKLLLVHGRYNYVRTSRFVLSTFYKELMFYLSQAIFQRNTMFTGTSLYEPWSLSMFNTLFTSLPVLCIGMFEKDLKPATLLAVPELYAKGRLSQAFNLRIFIGWMLMATTTSLLICFSSWYIWGFSSSLDNSLYPMGVLTYTAIVFTINIKINFLEQHDRTYLNFVALLVSCLGWLLWCCLLPGLYKETTSKIYDVYKGIYWKFGKDVTWWASLLIIVAMPLLYDYIVQMARLWIFPNDVDELQVIEKNTEARRKIELAAFDQMQQGWQWDKDETMIKRYIKRKRQGTVTLDTELPPGAPTVVQKNTAIGTIHRDDGYETEVLPSGKLIKRKVNDDSLSKKVKLLRFGRDKSKRTSNDSHIEQDIDAIIAERMKDLE